MIREHLKVERTLRSEVVLRRQRFVRLLEQIHNVRLERGALLFLQLDLEVRRLDELKLAARKAIQQVERVAGPDVESIACERGFENLGSLLLPDRSAAG